MTTLTLIDYQHDEQIASRLAVFTPQSIDLAFHTDRRIKPTSPNADGTQWGTVNTIVTLDAEGRIIAETFEQGEQR